MDLPVFDLNKVELACDLLSLKVLGNGQKWLMWDNALG